MIVAGFGFSTRATQQNLRDALHQACATAQLGKPHVLATAEDKLAALEPLAKEMSLPLHPVPQEVLSMQITQTKSARVSQERGVGSVAEAAALAAAGPGAHLLTTRIHDQDRLASCALAKGPRE